MLITIVIMLTVIAIVTVLGSKDSRKAHDVTTSYNPILDSKQLNSPTKVFIENNKYAGDDSKVTGSFNVAIKGLYYRSQREIDRARKIELSEELFLEKESGNVVDKFAVKVLTWDGYFIGYVQNGMSEHVTKMINKGYKLNCFLSKSTNNSIPYQYMDIYYLGQNPKYKPPKNNNVVYVDYNIRIKRLKENIKRCKLTADNAQRDSIRNNALNRIDEYRKELEKLEKIKSDYENN